MKKRFIYHDEKSNKFWWIDFAFVISLRCY